MMFLWGRPGGRAWGGMVDREEVGTKTEAFRRMVEFYAAIRIEINQSTIQRKYYRAEGVTNVTDEESDDK
jgi:hypothetical protein